MFEELVFKGLEEHIDLLDKYGEDVIGERIDREISTIEFGGVEDYFLVLRDIVNWCRANNILLGAGRGSAAGSLVTYLLGITKVDPMRYGLLFERFLNKGRLWKETEKEMVRIIGEDNLEIELDISTNCKIFRENKEMLVEAKDIQEGDEIISYK